MLDCTELECFLTCLVPPASRAPRYLMLFLACFRQIRQAGGGRQHDPHRCRASVPYSIWHMCVCVCVCVCFRPKEHTHTHTHTQTNTHNHPQPSYIVRGVDVRIRCHNRLDRRLTVRQARPGSGLGFQVKFLQKKYARNSVRNEEESTPGIALASSCLTSFLMPDIISHA